mmetsp:Transcript_69128/g.200164  ORF Transcript_69128/g.200164 Transcript_69128/m.200164 type:complete len:239 (-) Transcript_69128:465-1181(-)
MEASLPGGERMNHRGRRRRRRSSRRPPGCRHGRGYGQGGAPRTPRKTCPRWRASATSNPGCNPREAPAPSGRAPHYRSPSPAPLQRPRGMSAKPCSARRAPSPAGKRPCSKASSMPCRLGWRRRPLGPSRCNGRSRSSRPAMPGGCRPHPRWDPTAPPNSPLGRLPKGGSPGPSRGGNPSSCTPCAQAWKGSSPRRRASALSSDRRRFRRSRRCKGHAKEPRRDGATPKCPRRPRRRS